MSKISNYPFVRTFATLKLLHNFLFTFSCANFQVVIHKKHDHYIVNLLSHTDVYVFYFCITYLVFNHNDNLLF